MIGWNAELREFQWTSGKKPAYFDDPEDAMRANRDRESGHDRLIPNPDHLVYRDEGPSVVSSLYRVRSEADLQFEGPMGLSRTRLKSLVSVLGAAAKVQKS